MDSDLLKEHIYRLEKKLLKPEVRQSAEKVAEILSDDFIEFCSSGKIYKYEQGNVIDNKRNNVQYGNIQKKAGECFFIKGQ